MAIWPFNRKKTESTDLPQEVQDYYQSEKRQRAGVAGLLAVGTLIVTVLLALGLFFGGRWAYRTVFDKNDNDTTQTETNGTDNAPAEEPAPGSSQAPTPSTETPASQPSSSNAPAPASASSSASQSTNSIPDTGPGDVVALFIGTVMVATAAHYVITNKRQLV